jgi:nicotinate phosphoribosyltransferase
VYKLGAVRTDDVGTVAWNYAMKLSEQPVKISNPGVLAVQRLWSNNSIVGDIIYDVERGRSSDALSARGLETDAKTAIPQHDRIEELLVNVVDNGTRTDAASDASDLHAARRRAASDLAALSASCRRFHQPDSMWQGLDENVAASKRAFIKQAIANKTDTKVGSS